MSVGPDVDDIAFGAETSFADHREVPVQWRHYDITLGGTVYLPHGPGPFPGVVYVHGSGREARLPYRDDQTMRTTFEARPWVTRGFAVLAYDKRGVGESTGECCPYRDPPYFPQLAGDALSAIAVLASRPDVDAGRIGLYGLSQGGWVVPHAAALSAAVAFVVVASGPAVSLDEEDYFSALSGECPPSSLTLDEIYARMADAPHGGFDPVPDLSRLMQPAVFLQGMLDRSQPARLSWAVLQHLADSLGKPWQVAVFDDGDHILYRDGPPCRVGGSQIDWETPTFMWLLQKLGTP